MNLAENLKRMRKENNISQEQLAEQLSVSRQSVSKWESGAAYPEMDKLLQIAKIFNVNIDDLLNQNIKEVNSEKQSKIAINKGIEDFLSFISKTIDMFSSMKLKDKFKCLLEQAIIIGLFTLIFLIIGAIGNSILTNLLSFLPWEAMHVITSIFESIYVVCALVLGFILLVHIFKTRYLDYYEVVKEKEAEEVEPEEVKESAEQIVPKKEKKIYLEKKREKIVIRDPKHSEYKFVSGLLKCLVFVVKTIALFIAVSFCATLVAFVISLVISFVIAKTGLFFIGILLILLAFIMVNLIVLIILFNFLMNKKSPKRLLLIVFLSSLIISGIGAGMSAIGFTSFDYIDDIKSSVYMEDEIITPMEDDLIIDEHYFCYGTCGDVLFEYEERNDIRIVYRHSKYLDLEPYRQGNYLYLNTVNKNRNFLEMTRDIIGNLNNKEIINYGNFDITIYTSKENIIKLKSNIDNYYKAEEQRYSYTNQLEKKIAEYEQTISELEDKLKNTNNENENYKEIIEANSLTTE